MTDRAPGHEQAPEDLPCYNCGMKGHVVFACPEDTRRVPAGLEASRKRQASGKEYHTPAKRNRGPIVTHYPPPPPPGLPLPPPPLTYSPGSGYGGFHSSPTSDPPAGPPYHQPPHPGHYEQYPPYGERSASRGFPYGSSRDAYEHHFQGSPQASSPETLYRSPFSDQFDPYRPGSSGAPPYGRPYSARSDQYDDHPVGLRPISPYLITHPTSHQPIFDQYSRSPSVDNHYSTPPQPYPPSQSINYGNTYGHDGAFPVKPYPPGHGPPPPRAYSYQSQQHPLSGSPPYHVRRDDRFSDRSPYERQRDSRQHAERRSRENWHSRDRRDRRMRYDSSRGRSRSKPRFQDWPAKPPSPVTALLPAISLKHSTVTEAIRLEESPNNAMPVGITSTDNYSDDFSWEEEAIFKELPFKITRDLIWEPLPARWTDDPIMPPKYDKETITSKYVTPSNVDDFVVSIRKTEAWQVMQYHPTFLPPTEVRIEKLREYEAALNPSTTHNRHNQYRSDSRSSNSQYGKSRGLRVQGERQDRNSHHLEKNPLSNDDLSNYSPSGATKRSWSQANDLDAEEPRTESEISEKKQRISSPEPGEVCETDDQDPTSTTKSTSSPWEEEYSPAGRNGRDHIANDLQDYRVGHKDSNRGGNSRQSSPQTLSTSPQPRGRLSSSPSRSSSRRSSPGDPSGPSSRSNPSRPSSRHSSIGSPLTPNERELLGMSPYSSDSDTGRDSPIPQVNGASFRSRQRPAKVHAAYQRRW
ncbi:hypothetical protein F4861DRAFT_446565 [Xylaria intraflava]|nr:hypothetical protein F4861DRAFT_446565 [Xylaria intraflava]